MVKLELPYDIRLVSGTAYWLSGIAEQYGISARNAASLCFVIETALELRMRKPVEEGPGLNVTLKENRDTVSVSISDKGMPYVLTPKQREMLKGGLVSAFSFDQLAIEGQRLTFYMEKEIRAEPEPFVREQEVLQDTDIHCRPTDEDDEDILRAIRVIYSSYGFRYVHQEIYHHDHFRAALRSGKYVSILAENAHGQTIGHVALEEHEWFPGIPEVCNLVVKDFARGVGASSLLVAAAVKEGETKSFEGVYALPVAHHPISQKLFNKCDFTACGFYFHLAPSSILGPEKDDGNRIDAAICVKIMNKDRLHRLYLPPECEAFVRGVFEDAEVPYEVLPEGESRHSEPVLSYRFDAVNRLLELRVDNARMIAVSFSV